MDEEQIEIRLLEAYRNLQAVTKYLETGGGAPPMEWAWLDMAIIGIQRCVNPGGAAADEMRRDGEWRF